MKIKPYFILLAFLTAGNPLFAQHIFKVTLKDSLSKELLMGVAVKLNNTDNGAATNINGYAEIKNIPVGQQTFTFSYVGYKTIEQTFTFPLVNPDEIFTILLPQESGELEEVTVTSTRTNSRIEDLPMKVEVLGLDDMNEENTIKPGNISSILGDLSVIHIQQTSAVNGNSTVRMQGLDGKYTQILRDGLPLYEGFSGSFGILQIPPLDLKQVEIIKGSVSTLYGGGAISGLINLVSKSPGQEPEVSFTLNRTTLKETNINGYYAKKFGKLGLTMFAGSTLQTGVDVNGDGFSDVPDYSHAIVHPRLFYDFNNKTHLIVGYSNLYENRIGGDMTVITAKADQNHQYYERNISKRNTGDLSFSSQLNNIHKISLKGTLSLFNRSVDNTGFLFQGKQLAGYSEISDFIKLSKHEIVIGANYLTDKFDKQAGDTMKLENYDYRTAGFFVQDGWQIIPKFLIETGLRTDFHNKYGSFFLPRIAFLYKPNSDFSVRLSSGLGYKTPNIFTQQTLSGNFRNLLPLDNTITSEKSTGANFDVNYNTTLFGKVTMQVNQAFYFTQINNPIIPIFDPNTSLISLQNANFNIRSLGTDTYVRFELDHFELYLGYNHTIARRENSNSKVFLPFSPQDKFSSTIAYEIPDKWRFGIENSWVGNQYISAGTYVYDQVQKVRNYWFWAGMVERKFGAASLVLNCENIFDFRQSKIEALYTGTITKPSFKSLWAPIDGRVINLSLHVKI
jgi:outer membrane cobalamin receptor